MGHASMYLVFFCVLFMRSFAKDSGAQGYLDSLVEQKSLMDKVLLAMDKALGFYEIEYKQINLDGIFGLRVAEGSLLKVLQDEQSGKVLVDRDYLQKIRTLKTKAARISEMALPYLRKHNVGYFKKFEKQVSLPWTKFKPFRKIDISLYVPINKRADISMDEDTSDQCMTEMTGTGAEDSKPCQLSAHCWQLMMSKGAGGYTLTHQALFLLIGETQGCSKELEAKLQMSNNGITLQKTYDRICASMYPQMLKLEKNIQNLKDQDKDLYMEQAMVCGSMGYGVFQSKRRLKPILEWQKINGCFGTDDSKSADYHDISYGKGSIYDDDISYGKGGIYDDKRSYDKYGIRKVVKRREIRHAAGSRKLMSMRTMRSLLVEKALGGGCMSHITGVATGLLGVYVRWLAHSYHNADDAAEIPFVSHDQHLYRRKQIMMHGPIEHAVVSGMEAMEHEQKAHKTTISSASVFIMISIVVVGIAIIVRKILKSILSHIVLHKKIAHII